ncbi:penicillin-binding protein activator [Commensalibacter sp. Nvir]|uniref:penicillin-binding protein activator n=1 Tax=Commensalibacter sp. Nvir TaxID=3069817 RepID=UPI0030C7C555
MFKKRTYSIGSIFCHRVTARNWFTINICLFLFILASCSTRTTNETHPPIISGEENQKIITNGEQKIGLLLPLSGRNGALGQNMLNAAKLALKDTPSPTLDVQDTQQVGGAIEAARRALASGDAIILGPLTAKSTTEAASVVSMKVPLLAYTSDVNVAGPKVWVFGLTPEQQVMTMVLLAKQNGKTKFAGFFSDNALGHAMADGLINACSKLNLMQPNIVYHDATKEDIVQKLKILSEYDRRVNLQETRHAQQTPGEDKNSALNTSNDDLLNQLAPTERADKPTDTLAKVSEDSIPFDALLLSDTGLQLQSVIEALSEAKISSQQVQIMGPALWAAFAGKLKKLENAWYAAPDPNKRQGFVNQYMASYGQAPKQLSDLAYDTAALAKFLNQRGGYTLENLTRADGFDGVDGLFVLKADGHVKRDLQIFQIQSTGGAKMLPVNVNSSSDVQNKISH